MSVACIENSWENTVDVQIHFVDQIYFKENILTYTDVTGKPTVGIWISEAWVTAGQ